MAETRQELEDLSLDLCVETQRKGADTERARDLLTDTFDIARDYVFAILQLRREQATMPADMDEDTALEGEAQQEEPRILLAKMLREARERRGPKGVSCEQVGLNMKKSTNWIKEIEHGRSGIYEEDLRRLCSYYRVSAEPFLVVLAKVG